MVYINVTFSAVDSKSLRNTSVVGSEPKEVGSYPTIAILLFLFYFNFFKANKLRNNHVMTQVCVLSPNELLPGMGELCLQWPNFDQNLSKPITCHFMILAYSFPSLINMDVAEMYLMHFTLFCAVLCPPYSQNITANLRVSVTQGEGRNIGTVLSFSCSTNYHIVGDDTITCVNPGVWSGTVPACVRGSPG